MGLAADTLVLTPATATNGTGTSHTVTAHVADALGGAIVGVTVEFVVTVTNPMTGDDVTDVSGNAMFTYLGANAGTDTITAFADVDGDGTQDVDEPGDTATKTWVVMPKCPGHSGDTRNQVVGTAGADVLVGTAGADASVALAGTTS